MGEKGYECLQFLEKCWTFGGMPRAGGIPKRWVCLTPFTEISIAKIGRAPS